MDTKNFHKTKLSEIKWWAWAATVLPLTALAGMFFIEYIGTDDWYHIALGIGAMVMFGIAVVWWWWALWTILQVTNVLGTTVKKFDVVDDEIKEIKREVKKGLQDQE
jgi:hypothetical protein